MGTIQKSYLVSFCDTSDESSHDDPQPVVIVAAWLMFSTNAAMKLFET